MKKTVTALSIATIASAAAFTALPSAQAADDGAMAAVTGDCKPCEGEKCNPCAGDEACNPCAAEEGCNPCAAEEGCNPCAAEKEKDDNN